MTIIKRFVLFMFCFAISANPVLAETCSTDDVLQRAFAISLQQGEATASQVDPPTASGASAALVDSPQQTKLLAAALHQGLVNASNGGAISISLAPFAWVNAANRPKYTDDQDIYDRYDAARRLTGSITLGGKGDGIDSDGDGRVNDPAEAKKPADSVAVELQYRFFGSRDRRDHSVSTAVLDSAAALNAALVTSRFGDMIISALSAGVLSDEACADLSKRVAAAPDFKDVVALQRRQSSEVVRFEHAVDAGLVMSVAATALQRKDYLGPDKYTLALRGLKGLEAAEYMKFNVELGRIEHAGEGRRNIDSAKLAVEYSRPVLPGVDLGGGQPTFSAALAAEHYRNVLAPAPGTVATLGLKWVFPIAKGISIPFSISWANRTALLSDKDEVFGHVGINLDLDQLDKL